VWLFKKSNVCDEWLPDRLQSFEGQKYRLHTSHLDEFLEEKMPGAATTARAFFMLVKMRIRSQH